MLNGYSIFSYISRKVARIVPSHFDVLYHHYTVVFHKATVQTVTNLIKILKI